jgi:hypothetical protein
LFDEISPLFCSCIFFWSSLTSLAQLSVLEITTTFCTEFSFSCSFTDFLLWTMKVICSFITHWLSTGTSTPNCNGGSFFWKSCWVEFRS